MSKFTEWFSADVKPFRVGIYQVSNKYGELGYSYFNGNLWAWKEISPKSAYRYRNRLEGANQSKEWRGLAKKP